MTNKEWVEKLQSAIKRKKDWCDEFKVDMSRDYFDGKQNPGYPDNEWLTINKIYTHVQSQVPQLYSLDPYFYIKVKKSYKPDAGYVQQIEQKAKVRQAYLNYLKEEVGLKEIARMAILDAHFAFGCAKTRYHADEKDNPNKGQDIVDKEGNVLTDPATGEPLKEPEKIPVNQRYVVDWVNSDDFVFDPDAGPVHTSWKWVAQRIKQTRRQAKKNRNYNSQVINRINEKSDEKKNTGIISAVKDFVSGTDLSKKDDEIIELWEVYDIQSKQWLTVSLDADDFIMSPRPLPKGTPGRGHPYRILTFVKRTKSVYPIPPVFPGMDPQKEYNLARSRLMVHRKRFNRKYEAVIPKIEDPDTEIPKLEAGDDGTVVRVMAAGAFQAIQDAPLDQMSYQEILLLNNDLIETLGSPEAARGLANADSATEASIVDRRLEVREGDRMSMVVDFVIGIGQDLDVLVQTHIDKDEAVKITGPQGEFWELVRSEDYEEIEGEFEYSVNVGASQPRLPEIERSQWIAFMSQVVIPMPQVLTSPSFMKKMAELYHIDDEVMLEELRQLGLKMMSGVMPMPGNSGSQPSQNNPAAAIIGQAMGSLGGNNNGGGA